MLAVTNVQKDGRKARLKRQSSKDSSKEFVNCLNVIYFHGSRANVIAFTPIRNAQRSLRRFTLKWTTKLRVERSFMPNFTQIGQQIWKDRADIHLRPQTKHGCH